MVIIRWTMINQLSAYNKNIYIITLYSVRLYISYKHAYNAYVARSCKIIYITCRYTMYTCAKF